MASDRGTAEDTNNISPAGGSPLRKKRTCRPEIHARYISRVPPVRARARAIIGAGTVFFLLRRRKAFYLRPARECDKLLVRKIRRKWRQ